MFSATLLPIKYYKEQLGGKEDDYAVYAPSSFSKKNRIIMVAKDVSTKYTRRNEREYGKILNYIKEFTRQKPAITWFSFLPIKCCKPLLIWPNDIEGLVVQSANMTEEEREYF